MRHVLPLLAAFGCTQGDASGVATAGLPIAPVHTTRVRAGVPHGGAIRFVAATEAGDAAFTLDTLGELRLWPALDGTREPVPVPIASAAARELAVGWIGSELVGAILDEAGGVSIVRFGADGGMVRRAQLPAEVAAQQVVATPGGILVRRGDQTIERYDATGAMRSRVAAREGERIEMIAVRNGAAIAAIADGKDITKLRWLVLGKQLAWGEAIELPQPIAPAGFALAPGHSRVAAMLARTVDLGVITLGPKPAVQTTGIAASGAAIGFVDDDHVAVGGSTVLWWSAAKPRDPWAVTATTPPIPSNENAGAMAFSNRFAIGAYASGLALEEPAKTRYLGWRDPASGVVTVAGSLIGFGPIGDRYVWLDSRLAEARVAELPEFAKGIVQMVAVSDRQVVVVHRAVQPAALQVDLYDADRKALTPIGAFDNVQHLDFAPEVGVLTFSTDTEIERFAIDLAHSAVTRLDAVPQTSSYFARALDPSRADGAQLVAIQNDNMHATVYRASERTKLASELFTIPGGPLAIDPWGRIFTRSNEDGRNVVIERGGRELSRIKAAAMVTQLAVAHDGASVVYADGTNVVVTDLFGHERWHRMLWGPAFATYTTDDRHVIVQARGGVLLLDATTGNTAARACGWSFGVYDQPTDATLLASPPVCED